MGFVIKKNIMQARNTDGEMEPLGLIVSTKEEVNEWLNKHPEATTSIRNNSISKEKLTKALSNEITESTVGVKKNTKDISDLYEEKADRSELASPYKFKGSVNALSNLPKATADNWNDTYYVINEKQRYTSNGSGWFPSSMSEGDYTDELGKVVSEESLANEFTKISYKIGGGGIEVPTMDEFNELNDKVDEINNIISTNNQDDSGVIIAGKKIIFNSDGTVTWEKL